MIIRTVIFLIGNLKESIESIESQESIILVCLFWIWPYKCNGTLIKFILLFHESKYSHVPINWDKKTGIRRSLYNTKSWLKESKYMKTNDLKVNLIKVSHLGTLLSYRCIIKMWNVKNLHLCKYVRAYV